MRGNFYRWGLLMLGLSSGMLNVASLDRSVHAQESTLQKSADVPSAETSRKEASVGVGKSASTSVLPAPTTRWLPNKNDELVPVPNNASLEDYLRFAANRDRIGVAPPPATISVVKITGTADDERASLEAVFTIRLQAADQWVRVPLFLNEALLKQSEYSGDGEAVPDEKDRDQGYIWWFHGRGPHRLNLHLSVPLKKQMPSRRLVVTLPGSPVTRAQLTLPYVAAIAKAPEQTTVEVRPASDGRSVIEALGFGNRLELSWQPTSEVRSTDVSLESRTTILAQVDVDQVQVLATQRVDSLHGPLGTFVVRLPTGAELIKLEGAEKPSYKFDGANKQRILVSLDEKSANSADLRWTLRLPAKGRSLTIDGFVVEGARMQVGEIGLAVAEGLRLLDPSIDPSILKINAGEFRASMGSVSVVHAYRFLSQPFKLTTTVEDVKPYFRVKPRLLVTASAQQLTLEGMFDYHVDRDSLNEVVLTWPDHKIEGWTIDIVDEPGVVEGYSIDEKGQITARLVKRQSAPFTVHIRARRPLKSAEDITFTLPRPTSASRVAPSTLILINAENVDTDLSMRGETVMYSLPASAVETSSLPETTRLLKVSPFRIDTDEHSFGLRVIPQKQQIRTESLTEARWEEDQFRLVQHLIYEVAYERLTHVRVQIPASIAVDQVRFFNSREIELKAELLPSLSSGFRQLQIKLGESQLGRFEIQARLNLPFGKHSTLDAVVNLPILGSLDAPFSQTRLSLARSDWFDAEPLVEIWKPQLNREEAFQWLAEGSPTDVELKLVRSTHAGGTGSISRALITVQLDGAGQGQVRAQFRLMTRVTSLPVMLPETAKTAVFYWDQQRLADRDCIPPSSSSRPYRIQLREPTSRSLSGDHLLTVEYQDTFGSAFGWSDDLELRSPQLPNCSSQRVIWQAVLPPSQHLFTYPSSATPMFRWQRIGFYWGRNSVHDPDSLQQWVSEGTAGSSVKSDTLEPSKAGNLYAFSQFGSPQSLSFRTLSSPIVLLMGAGFSLAVGFVLLRLAILRHVMSLLIIGLMLAIAGLWYAGPLELLLQPMIAGLMFPVTAVLLDAWIRRRYENDVLAFNGHGEFSPVHSLGSHYVLRQTDPNGDTQMRMPERESQSSVPVESRSGVS